MGDTLRLLTQTVGQSMGSIFGILGYNHNDNGDTINDNHYLPLNDILNEEGNNLKISIIQSIDSSTVFLKSSDDDKIHFVPFRKPLDSFCSQKEYSFQSDCVNVHNVRDVEYHSKNKELEFLVSGSYPRLIEINEKSTVILNDRVFGISESGEFKEFTNGEHYQDGNKFCLNNILFIRDNGEDKENRIIISGSCYGLLYLPKYV